MAALDLADRDATGQPLTARRQAERGQVIVEFAFAASLTLLLFFGIIEFGWALYNYDLVGQAARYGTRYAIVHATSPTDCSNPTTGTLPCEQADTQAIISKFGLDPNSVKLTYTWEGPSLTCIAKANPGCYVQIEVDEPFTFVALPFIPSITLKSTSRMTIAR